jgi:hypothetical protein
MGGGDEFAAIPKGGDLSAHMIFVPDGLDVPGGKPFFAGSDDRILEAACDHQKTVRLDPTRSAGPKPASFAHRWGGLGIVVTSPHGIGTPYLYFPLAAGAYPTARYRPTQRAEFKMPWGLQLIMGAVSVRPPPR